MTRTQLFTFLFFILPILYFLSLPIAVGDMSIWVAQGRYILEHGEILRHDIFSVLNTHELIYPALTCFLYGLLDKLGGLVTVSLIHKFAIFVFLIIIYKKTLNKLDHIFTGNNLLIISFALYGSSIICIDRPATLAIIPFILAYYILSKKTQLTNIDRLKLSLITLFWVNIHGSWILLPLMYFWRLLAKKKLMLRTELFTLIGIGVASLASPFTWKNYTYIIETAKLSKERSIDEWATTGLSVYFPQGPLFFFLVTIIFAITVYKIRREKNFDILSSPFFPLLLLGFVAIRNTSWPFLALIPFGYEIGIMNEKKDRQKSEVIEQKNKINIVITVTSILLCILFFPTIKGKFAEYLPKSKREVFDSSAPFGAVNAIKFAENKGPIFNDWDYGSFLAYAQDNKIFIDTRNIIYSQNDFNDYLTVIHARDGWESVLNRYKIHFVLLKRQTSPFLISQLKKNNLHWKIIWQDSDTELYEFIPLSAR